MVFCRVQPLITYIMGFVEHNHSLFRKLLGNLVRDLRIQEVVVTVHYNVGMRQL